MSTSIAARERVPFDSISTRFDPGWPRPATRRVGATLLPEPGPRELWCPIISADDHVLEPADLFERRVASNLVDRAPYVVEDESGSHYWCIEDRFFPVTVVNGAVGRPQREWILEMAQRFTDFRPGVYETAARIEDMDLNGVWASLCFPSLVWGFAGRRFSTMGDPDLGLACMRAYNDWMLDEWCGSSPGRFVPCQIPWLSDPRMAGAEVRKNAERGFRAVTFPETPDRLGFPSIYSDHWDPFFAACEETGTVVNLHVGSSNNVAQPSSESPIDVITVLFPVSGLMAITDWIYARVPLKFPRIKIALSEAGVSWVPMLMERLDRAYRTVDASDSWSVDDPHPKELAHRNFWFTSICDPSAFHALDLIGEDHVVLESDYPHQDSTWPDTQALIREHLHHLHPSTVRKIAYENAASLYDHPQPPQAWLERSTVGAPS